MESKTHNYDIRNLLMFSSNDMSRVNNQIIRNIDVWFNVNNVFMEDDIYKVLAQRISYLGWEVCDKEKFIDAIVKIVGGDVNQAVELLGWSYSCCRAGGEDRISLKHLNRALHLLNSAVDVEDDIPF